MVLETGNSQITEVQAVSNMSSVPLVTGGAQNALDACLETVVNWVTTRYGKNSFKEPLEEFMRQFGKVFPEDEFFQDRMNYFLEHTILKRPMTGLRNGCTPIVGYMDDIGSLLNSADPAWQSFCDFRHTIFEVAKVGSSQISVKDLLSDQVLAIVPKANETLKYVEKKSMIQGFVYGGANNQNFLGQGLIIHPSRARKTILKQVKAHKKKPQRSDADFLTMLARNNLKYLRMHHVDPAIIYQLNS